MKNNIKTLTVKAVAILTVLLLTAAMLPLMSFASEAEEDEYIYLSISYDGEYINDKNGDPIVYIPIPLDAIRAIDLTEYGLEEMLFDADGDGEYETTALQLLIYAHENIYGGDWSDVDFDAIPGSSYFRDGIFGFTENLVYFHNGDFPVDESQESDYMIVGATSDRIVLKPGDFLDVASFECYSFLWDILGGFHFFADDSGEFVHDFEVNAGEPLSVNLLHSFCDLMFGMAYLYEASDYEIYYGKTYGVVEGTLTTDGSGNAEITIDEPGVYYIWCYGAPGSDDGTHGGCDHYNEYMEPCIVSAPAYARITVIGESNTTVAEGSCGVDAYWRLDNSGVLTIYGEGSTFYYTGKGMPWYDYKNQITKVVVEEGIVSIGASSFYEFTNITEIVLSDGLKAIGQYAFYGCSSVTDLIIPESVYHIGNYAFRKMGTKNNINISFADPNGWFKGDEAISSEYMADTAAIGEELRAIGYLQNWNKVSEDPTVIAEGACGKTATWVLDSNGTLTISGTGYMTEFLTKGAPWFNYNASIINVVIEEGIKKVGKCSFYGADNILSVQLPESLEIISPYAFYYCRNLKEINVPANVTTIGQYAFRQCKALTSIDLGIKYGWSAGETPITSTELSAENAVQYFTQEYYTATWTRDESAEDDSDPNRVAAGICGSNLKWQLNVNGTLTISGTGAMNNYNSAGDTLPWAKYADQITKVVVEEGVTSIGDYAFYNVFTKIESVTLPESLTSIGKYAFYGCSAVKELTVPANVTSIGTMAFRKMGATGKLSVTFAVTEGWTCGGNAVDFSAFADAKAVGTAIRSAEYASPLAK